MPIKGLQIKKEITNDTLENRFIKYMISRLINKLYDLQDTMMKKRKWENEKTDTEIIDKVYQLIKQLENKLKSPFWKRIGRLDRSIHSLVLQMAPGYRDAYQIFLTVSKGLSTSREILSNVSKGCSNTL